LRKGGKEMQAVKNLIRDEKGIGTVEMILILVVLIALVLIFKEQLTDLVNNIFDKITKQSNQV
jgi:Flp pilus assembly pilin Flp